MRLVQHLSAALLLILTAAGCAAADRDTSAPSTFFLSQEAEQRLGREEHPKVLAQFGGAYEDPELQAFIERVGERVKNVTELKDQSFTFTVLDNDVVNAFALPGGYVYVTRGLLSLANNEAEVAGVLGHEIAHVVARHTAQRYDRTALGQIGAVGAQVLGGLFGGYFGGEAGAQLGSQLGGQLGSLGAQAWVQGFSREQEFESDELGIRYLAEAGYDPIAMASFLQALQSNDEFEASHAERQRQEIPGWLRSHPRTPDRVTRAATQVSERMPSAQTVDRDDFLQAIDGMIYGENPEQGFVRGRRFEHPGLGFAFEAPPGFSLKNTPAEVIGTDGRGRIMKFDLDPTVRSRDLRSYIQNEWVTKQRLDEVQRLDIAGRDAAVGFGQVEVNGRPATAMFSAVRGDDGRVYRFLFASAGRMSRDEVRAFEDTLRSFRTLSAREAGALRPRRLDIVTVQRGDTIDSLARQMEVDEDPRGLFVLLNGLDRGRTLQPGDKVKIVKRA